ncbi:restriction endonuclease subunit S [Pseudoscardovia radai]|uniref:restriction endonuclease subunit S n=1 Tax=Pseudoscardovia radai TaxID=987066 RepID=UPI0039918409
MPSVEYEDVEAGRGALTRDFTSKEGKRGICFEPGDVLYGKLRPYLGNRLKPAFRGVAVGDWWVLEPSSVASSFLFSLIQSPRFITVANQSSGSKMPRADWKLVGSAAFGIPPLPEQRRIGVFFSTLDNLIAAAERQEALLRQKKQAYLQLMFPREGETEPRLRFAGFSGEWETRRFGEIFQYERPDAYLAGDDEIEDEGAIPVLTANKAFILGYTNSFQGIYQKGRCIIFDDFTLDSKRVERPFKVRSSAIKILTVRENMDFDFAFELLRTSKFPLLGHARHYITVVQPQAALIPHSLQEQQHIGKFFSTLDSLITAAEERTKHLRELKGSYLQRMFV